MGTQTIIIAAPYIGDISPHLCPCRTNVSLCFHRRCGSTWSDVGYLEYDATYDGDDMFKK